MTLGFAHRGFSGKYPENTLLAFEKALEAGCDGIELDVQLSRDGEVMILHDESLKRTTGIKGYIWEYTKAELKQLDASGKYTGQFGWNQIPTLREYFELVKSEPIITNIELKTNYHTYLDIEEKVVALIDEYELRNSVIISSFNHHSILQTKKIAPDISCAILEESQMVGLVEYAKRLGADYINVNYRTIMMEVLFEAAACGMKLNAWTVNERADMEMLAAARVYGIIGNYPDVMREVLHED